MMMDTVNASQTKVQRKKPVVVTQNSKTPPTDNKPVQQNLPNTTTKPNQTPKPDPQDVLKATQGLKGKEKIQTLEKVGKLVSLKQKTAALQNRSAADPEVRNNSDVKQYYKEKQEVLTPIAKATTTEATAEVKAKQPKTSSSTDPEVKVSADKKLKEKEVALERFTTAGSTSEADRQKALKIIQQEKSITVQQEQLETAQKNLNNPKSFVPKDQQALKVKVLQEQIIQKRQQQALGDIDAQNLTPEAKTQAKASFKAQQATQLAKDTGLDANLIKQQAEAELRASGIQYDQIQTTNTEKKVPQLVTHEDRLVEQAKTKTLYEQAKKPGDKPTETLYSVRLNKDNKIADPNDKEAVDIKLSGITTEVKKNGQTEYSRTIEGKDGKKMVITGEDIAEVSLYAKNKYGQTVRGGLVVGREGAGKNEIIARQNTVVRGEDGSVQIGDAKVVSRTQGNWGINQGYRIEKDVVGADVDNGDQTINIRPDGKVEVVSGTGNWFSRGNDLKDVEKDLAFNNARLTSSNPANSPQPKTVSDLSKEQKQKLNIADNTDANTVLTKDQREQVATEASRLERISQTRSAYENATAKNYTFADEKGTENPLVNIGDNYKVQLSNILETKDSAGNVTGYSRVIRAEDGRKIVVSGKTKQDVDLATEKDKPGLKIAKTWTGDFGTDFQVSQNTEAGDKLTQRVRSNWDRFGPLSLMGIGTPQYRVEIDDHNGDVYSGDMTVFINNDGKVQDAIAGTGNLIGHGYNLSETGHTLAQSQNSQTNTQQSTDVIEPSS
ncbi:MAG: hypothetical protein ACKO37_07430 [Vampirovibrionales bacterium]